MTEAEVQSAVWRCVGSRPDVRLWRNNSGVLFDRNGRPVRYGVGQPGGSDLIGMRSVVVTPEMVGRKLAVFTAIEVKTTTGRVAEVQQHFIDFVQSFGGIAGIARSPDDAGALVDAGFVVKRP